MMKLLSRTLLRVPAVLLVIIAGCSGEGPVKPLILPEGSM